MARDLVTEILGDGLVGGRIDAYGGAAGVVWVAAVSPSVWKGRGPTGGVDPVHGPGDRTKRVDLVEIVAVGV